MKKLVILFLLIAILYIALIRADSFSIIWGTSQGGVTIGGGGSQLNVPPIGNVTTPGVTPPSGGTAGGGGGAVVLPGNLTVEKSLLVIKMKKGVPTQQKLTITNNKAENLSISISILNLSNYIFPTENSFTLKPGESRDVILNIYVSESIKENLLIGKVIFHTPTEDKTTDVVLDLQERAPMFDIKTTLLKKILFPGDRAIANVRVLNLGDLKNIDVELESMILDSKNNILDSKKETFAIDNSADKQVFLRLPDELPIGDYFFSSKVSYQNISAKSYDSFKIFENVINFGVLTFYVITAIIITLIALLSAILTRKIKNNREEEIFEEEI